MQRSKYYDCNLVGALHDTLRIISPNGDTEWTLKSGEKEITKQWLCECRLCGQQPSFPTEAFPIMRSRRNQLDFTCQAHCSCHQTSSFDWMVLYLLRKNKVRCDVLRPMDLKVGEITIHTSFQFFLYAESEPKYECALEFYSNGEWLAYAREANSDQMSELTAQIKAKRDWCEAHQLNYVGMVNSDIKSMEQLERRMVANKLW